MIQTRLVNRRIVNVSAKLNQRALVISSMMGLYVLLEQTGFIVSHFVAKVFCFIAILMGLIISLFLFTRLAVQGILRVFLFGHVSNACKFKIFLIRKNIK